MLSSFLLFSFSEGLGRPVPTPVPVVATVAVEAGDRRALAEAVDRIL
jgi:hypothetical protein